MKKIFVLPFLLTSVFCIVLFASSSLASPTDSDGDGVNDFREEVDGTDATSSNSFNPLSKGLVACFMFSGSADDTSGYGNHGTSFGAVLSLDRLGMENNAYLFEGSSYIEIPNSPSLSFGMSDLTVSVWVKTTNPNFGFIYSDDGDARRPGFEFSHWGAATYFEFSNQGIWGGLSNGENAVNNGEWRHLALSFSRSIIRVYVNGKLDMERIPQPDWEQLGDISNSHPSRIGRNIFGFDNPFQGSIDDVRLYNRALTAQEIDQLFRDSLPDSDGDGIPDTHETNTGVYVSPTNTGTDPTKADTDGDGLSDGVEKNTGVWVSASDTGTDPNNPDTDNDTLRDGAETNTGTYVSAINTGTHPNNADTSGDGITDGEAVNAQFNPLIDQRPVLNFLTQAVAAQPNRFGFYIESNIMHLAMGGLMIRKSGSAVNLDLQWQTKSSLTNSWTNHGAPMPFFLNLPGSKAFIRLQTSPGAP